MDSPPKLGPEEWKNIYRDKDGHPRLQRSVVAFIDLLGFRSAVVRAHAKGRQHEFLLSRDTVQPDDTIIVNRS